MSAAITSLSLEVFRHAAEHPKDYAVLWKKNTGARILGYFCSYAPEEMVTAAGALAFRILPSGRAISRADAHLQPYGCHLVRGTLEDALAGELDFLDGAIFPHTCDSIQRLSDIWRMNTTFGFHGDLLVPAKLNTPSSVDYLAGILGAFRDDLGKWTGTPISADALGKAVALHNSIRKSLHRLYLLRNRRPTLLPGRDWHVVTRASQVMERVLLADHLDSLVATLENAAGQIDTAVKRVVISGGMCITPSVYTFIEAAGGAVVWDDLCTGARYCEGLVSTGEPPETALARRYASRVVCPAKHAGLTRRGDYLIEAVARGDAHGVIFLMLKFCDPHAFDYPYLKQMLDDRGIPSLLVEVEDPYRASGQLQTRCQAFMEML